VKQKPIGIELKKHGKNWSVLAEEKLVALTVYRKGAVTVEALLRGLIRYSGRALFREALKVALAASDAKPKAAKKSNGPRVPQS
jgi:hypothetical protein